MKKFFLHSLCAVALVFVSIFIVISCKKDEKKNPVVSVTGVTLNLPSYTLELGGTLTVQLTPTVVPENASNKDVTWNSSNSEIVGVSTTGLVTAKAQGTATITVTTVDGSKTAHCDITVLPAGDPIVAVESVKITQNGTIRIALGSDPQPVSATISPQNAGNRNVTWTSDDEDVAIVIAATEGSGLNAQIEAVGVGTATITVTTEDGKKTDFIEVEVYDPSIHVESIELNEEEYELNLEETLQLIVIFTPEESTNKKVTWTSDDEDVATVDQNGLVTAVGFGEARITATTEDGGKTAFCDISVPEISLDNVEFAASEIDLSVGETKTLTLIFTPNNATNKKVTWDYDEDIVTINTETGEITGVAVGSTTITVTSDDGGHEATCQIEVKAVPVIGVELNKTSTTIAAGNSEILTVTFQPANATDKGVTWTSSNEGVATVAGGVVTAVGGGTTVISVKTDDGGFEASCTVKVPEAGLIIEYDFADGETHEFTTSDKNGSAVWLYGTPFTDGGERNSLITEFVPDINKYALKINGQFPILAGDGGWAVAICFFPYSVAINIAKSTRMEVDFLLPKVDVDASASKYGEWQFSGYKDGANFDLNTAATYLKDNSTLVGDHYLFTLKFVWADQGYDPTGNTGYFRIVLGSYNCQLTAPAYIPSIRFYNN